MSLHSTPEDRHAAFGDDWKPLDYPELVHPEPRADEPPVYDHKAEAERMTALLLPLYELMEAGEIIPETSVNGLTSIAALAQVHATLALVAEQHLSNLIAAYAIHPSSAIRERIGKELGI